jgi:hypothetical protein
MRSWRRTNQRRLQKPGEPRCTICGQRVLPQEPAFELEHRTANGRLHFHERERCGVPAFEVLVAGDPGVWTLTHRYRDADAN